ncbi:MAG: sensor histidine kinase N-terminal domain-containing protein [Gallionella sp.]|jgi:two-component system sensor histidine kinase TctE|nr:sensor histidine kinase N-terminal domain-containing protein [Gallionella sp.]MCK9353459.1 sensor histidine kinase N-terminal domain-containing protein [Gallionella sp.]
MSVEENKVFSLRSYLMQRLLISLYLLWLVSTVVGYFATINYANQPYDQVLLQRANAVAEQLRLGSGHEQLDVTPSLPDGTEPGMPDRVVYTVTDSEGRKLAGNGNTLRPLSYRRGRTGPLFSNGEREGQKTRMVSLTYPSNGKLLQLHVSETTQQRQMLIRGILSNIVIPQLLLTLIALAVVWYGLKQGLRPLERLRSEVESRKRDDLSQLDGSQAPTEVRPLIDAVNDLLERLKQVMAAQQRFVADAAHQLRTPFAGLRTQSELALRSDDPQQKQLALEHILTSTQHGIRLVNQLLALARNEPDAQDTHNFTTIDLNRLAQECTVNWVTMALEKNIDLGYESASATQEIQGDSNSLTEMLNNLIDNAIRYTPTGGHITVGLNATPQGAELSVEDNGPGIAPQHRERVFERFYRILGSGQSGSGLGLAIVAEVAKRHGAEIRLDEGIGGSGLRIAIRFPTRMPEQ